MNCERKLTIRKLQEEDLPYRVSLLNNELISHSINTSEIFELGKTKDWFELTKNSTARYDVTILHGQQIIGMGGLTSISRKNKNAELYIYINPDFFGRGFGKWATFLLCNLGFRDLKLEKIYLFTFSKNVRANNLYLKCGFKQEGLLRKHTFKDNFLQDRFIFGLLKEEFHNLKF